MIGAVASCVGRGDLLDPVDPPSLARLAPATGAPGSSVPVNLVGANFVADGTSVTVQGAGITVLNMDVASDTLLNTTFQIDSSATPGPRLVAVHTAGGTSDTQSFVVTTQPPALPTIGSFTASPNTIGLGGSSTLSWSGITNATTCSLNQGVGTVTCDGGSRSVSPIFTTMYAFTATGPGGTVTDSVTVTVALTAAVSYQHRAPVGNGRVVVAW